MLAKEDRQQVRDAVAEAVKEAFAGDMEAAVQRAVDKAMAEHRCRFDKERAEVLHVVSQRLDADKIEALVILARALNGAGAKVGQIVVWGLAVALASLVAWAINRTPPAAP